MLGSGHLVPATGRSAWAGGGISRRLGRPVPCEEIGQHLEHVIGSDLFRARSFASKIRPRQSSWTIPDPVVPSSSSSDGLPREETGSTWASSKASMNARIWSAVASLGERPRCSSRTRFGSPVASRPNVDGLTPVRSRNASSRDSNSSVSVSMPLTHGLLCRTVGSRRFGNSCRTIGLTCGADIT